jgi:fatty acid desaturase
MRSWAQQVHAARQRPTQSTRAIVEGFGLWVAGSMLGAHMKGCLGLVIGWSMIFVALIRLQYLFHESAHRTLFKHVWVNDLLGAVLGSIALVPHAAYRARHLEHHANTRADIDARRDPEGFYDEVYSRCQYLLTIALGGPYYVSSYSWLVIRSTSGFASPQNLSSRSLRNIQTWGSLSLLGSPCLMLILFTSGRWHEMVTWWLLPVGLFLSSVFTMMGFFEHHGIIRNTPIVFASATVRSNAFCRWLTLNALYHRAHHVLPSTPFHRLQDVEREIIRLLQHHCVIDAAPHHSGIIAFHRNLWVSLPWTVPEGAHRRTPVANAPD